MCNRRYLYSSMIGMLCTAIWVPSRAIHIIRCCPWIIFFDSGLHGSYTWFCRRSCWTACRSKWTSIFWINSRTMVLCVCFTTECGSPGIRKFMSVSFTIIFSCSLTKCLISNVERFAFMNRTCLRTFWHIFCVYFNNEYPRSLMCLFNVGILTVFRWTCLDYTRFNNGSLRSFRRNSFLREKNKSISWERDVFVPCCTWSSGIPRRLDH